jgi:hypothetical protein
MVLKCPDAGNDQRWTGKFPGGDDASDRVFGRRQVMEIKWGVIAWVDMSSERVSSSESGSIIIFTVSGSLSSFANERMSSRSPLTMVHRFLKFRGGPRLTVTKLPKR